MKNSYINYQRQFDVRCEWGREAIEYLSDSTDVFIVVDILSFSTCVDIATSRNASILPYQYKDDSAVNFALQHNAELAVHRTEEGSFSLSPVSMLHAQKGQRIVLPSPNGATLSMLTKEKTTLAGCLRNAKAVAEISQKIGKSVTIIQSGERWPNGSIRFALEDAIGAGAILSYMQGKLSPEAEYARMLFQKTQPNLTEIISNCISGNELINRDSDEDIKIASLLNASSNVPILKNCLEYVSFDPSIKDL